MSLRDATHLKLFLPVSCWDLAHTSASYGTVCPVISEVILHIQGTSQHSYLVYKVCCLRRSSYRRVGLLRNLTEIGSNRNPHRYALSISPKPISLATDPIDPHPLPHQTGLRSLHRALIDHLSVPHLIDKHVRLRAREEYREYELKAIRYVLGTGRVNVI